MAISPRLRASRVSSVTVGSVRLVSAKTSELIRAVLSSFMVLTVNTIEPCRKIGKIYKVSVPTLAADLDWY